MLEKLSLVDFQMQMKVRKMELIQAVMQRSIGLTAAVCLLHYYF